MGIFTIKFSECFLLLSFFFFSPVSYKKNFSQVLSASQENAAAVLRDVRELQATKLERVRAKMSSLIQNDRTLMLSATSVRLGRIDTFADLDKICAEPTTQTLIV